MPKVIRGSQNQGYYRSTPLTVVSNNGVQSRHTRVSSQNNNQIQDLAQAQIQISDTMPQLPSAHQHQQSHQNYYSTASAMQQAQQYAAISQQGYPNGGPVQQPLQYQTIQPQVQQPPVVHSLRPSSGAWSTTDDQTLMTARAQSMGWASIQSNYFPNKTSNACRKRHERLVENSRNSGWDGAKMQNLARQYMAKRRDIWKELAAESGEKWTVVEAKCMEWGLKNLGAAARSGIRQEKRELNRNSTTFEDDSGLGMDEEEGFSDGSNGNGYAGYANAGLMVQQQQQQAAYDAHAHRRSTQQQQQYQQRLASMDMGIGSIINRPN
ncbi:myb family transcription factor [Phlyctema vagabunda]|uniref:Myb family transcription factor n=1 Tax=Phlyctema vagabunda TaxID=108571 RepID=A0ABR4PQE7_9HELO